MTGGRQSIAVPAEPTPCRRDADVAKCKLIALLVLCVDDNVVVPVAVVGGRSGPSGGIAPARGLRLDASFDARKNPADTIAESAVLDAPPH